MSVATYYVVKSFMKLHFFMCLRIGKFLVTEYTVVGLSITLQTQYFGFFGL